MHSCSRICFQATRSNFVFLVCSIRARLIGQTFIYVYILGLYKNRWINRRENIRYTYHDSNQKIKLRDGDEFRKEKSGQNWGNLHCVLEKKHLKNTAKIWDVVGDISKSRSNSCTSEEAVKNIKRAEAVLGIKESSERCLISVGATIKSAHRLLLPYSSQGVNACMHLQYNWWYKIKWREMSCLIFAGRIRTKMWNAKGQKNPNKKRRGTNIHKSIVTHIIFVDLTLI